MPSGSMLIFTCKPASTVVQQISPSQRVARRSVCNVDLMMGDLHTILLYDCNLSGTQHSCRMDKWGMPARARLLPTVLSQQIGQYVLLQAQRVAEMGWRHTCSSAP